MEKYLYKDVYESTLKYFNGDELAASSWINKYSLKDSDNNYYEMNPDDMHKRIASELFRIESKYENGLKEEEIYELIKDFKYIIPQGSPMSGIGNNLQTVSLSNCFVVGNEADSYGGIFLTDQEQAQLMKRRGGVGHDLSHIRPRNTKVNNSALISTGIVPFMERFSNTTREVAQDGRRGALMLSCSIEHPNAENFIDAKLEAGKVTGANISVKITDEFMKSVIENKEYTQKFPVGSEKPTSTNIIDAKKLWDKIIHNAWKSAEPGVLFWDTIINESVADCYADLGFRTISTNPCVVGETLIAVADGRNAVSIKQLTLEGKDVPVYCLDRNGGLVIRTMRNPRITGYKQQLYKVSLENGHSMRVTGNHKLRLKDGSYVEAKDLKEGDSLHIMTKYEASIEEIFPNSNSRSSNYYWLNNGDFKSSKSEHRFIYEQTNDKIKNGDVIHHKDFNSLNNSLENLILMSKKEHDRYHGDTIRGEKNPYHRMSDDWKKNFASGGEGIKNSKYINISNEELKNHAIILTKKLDRRFSKEDWIVYAKENNIPQSFSNFRSSVIGNVLSLSKLVALELGYDNVSLDPRLVKTYKKSLENGYNSKIENNQVLVEKFCEHCGESFWINYFQREISFCSNKCSLNHLNKNEELMKIRIENTQNTYKRLSEETKNKQLDVFTKLRYELGRDPLLKEWEEKCSNLSISHRLNTKNGFNNFKELKEESLVYNHRIISVELDGFEDVYNGTVDEFHNFFSGEFQEYTKSNKNKYIYVNQLQCGEIPLCSYDSCRLLCVNLYSYVIDPFTKNARFDFDLFAKHTQIAERFMDDIVDLEIEKIEAILKKIESDPEDNRIKMVEIDLWNQIMKKTIEGRRTGLGITAEGDMLAALNLTYGTPESTKVSVEIHKIFALSAYKSSCIMAQERGSFPIYDYEKELKNPFINRLRTEFPELDEMLKKGRRNISLLTCAPTGTVSLMTQTTSGIEPAFMVYYKRRRKINPNDKNAKSVFVDESGDHWEEYLVFHHKFLIWLEINGYDVEKVKNMSDDEVQKIVERSPYFKATSNDVDWVEKVKLQGAIQKWIDHSISVTINLPNTVTEELVSKVYETGWSSGCKGMTVYRDGSRSGVLISAKEETKEETEEKVNNPYGGFDSNAPKRPKSLKCDVVRFTNKGDKWIGFVGLHKYGEDELRPYEIFTGLLDSFQVPSYVESGEISKSKIDGISRYDFVYKDKDGYPIIMTGLNRAFDREHWNYGKMISGVLRHRMPIKNVVDLIDSLKFAEDNIVTWKAGVKRMLKKYIKSESMGEKCPNCGSVNYHHVGGCDLCADCGFSRKCS